MDVIWMLRNVVRKLMAANVLHDAHQALVCQDAIPGWFLKALRELEVAVFYFVPAIVFLLFLFSSYDTEATPGP